MEKINILSLDLNTIGTMRKGRNSMVYINSNTKFTIYNEYNVDVLTIKELRRDRYGA